MNGLSINNQGFELSFPQAECLKQEKKAKASSELWQTQTYLGWALVEDGVIKYTEKDADLVNETVAHAMLMAHSFAMDILVVGAADGFLVKHILQHTSVRKIDWVLSHHPSFDIAKAHFNLEAFINDDRLNIIESPSLDYLRSHNGLYDIAFSDHMLQGSHQLEHTHDYYQALSNHMKTTGMVLFTSGLWVADHKETLSQKKMVQNHFPRCGISAMVMPCKMGGLQAWIWAANKDMSQVDTTLLQAKMEISPFECQHYTIAKHEAFFNPFIEATEY
ncbi:hypothetical protein N9C31_01000 [Gammaproteobacteria bacterium]|nr:hypothetical protein [Gammaproteobacteria bacterium]